MLATILSAALQGIEAEPVHVEVNSGERGDPKLILVGLPDAGPAVGGRAAYCCFFKDLGRSG